MYQKLSWNIVCFIYRFLSSSDPGPVQSQKVRISIQNSKRIRTDKNQMYKQPPNFLKVVELQNSSLSGHKPNKRYHQCPKFLSYVICVFTNLLCLRHQNSRQLYLSSSSEVLLLVVKYECGNDKPGSHEIRIYDCCQFSAKIDVKLYLKNPIKDCIS